MAPCMSAYQLYRVSCACRLAMICAFFWRAVLMFCSSCRALLVLSAGKCTDKAVAAAGAGLVVFNLLWKASAGSLKTISSYVSATICTCV